MRLRYELLFVAGLTLAACHRNNDTAIGPNPQPAAGQTTTPTTGTTPPTSSTGPVVTPGTTTGGSSSSRSTSSSSSSSAASAGGAFVIFADELRSGGGAFEFPGGENQTLSFDDRSNPVSANSIRYVWNGLDVAGQHVFAGFDLMHTGTLAEYSSTPGRNLQSGHFTRVEFDIRGSLSQDTIVKIEVADDGNPNTPAPCAVFSTSGQEGDSPNSPAPCFRMAKLDSTWQRFTIPLTPQDLASVKDFFKATFIFKGPSSQTGHGGTVFFDEIEYLP